MTDGSTEGRDDKTTAMTVPPQAAPQAPEDGRPKVMLLGSGELSRELAVALRHIGARVIVVDEHPHAPADAVADQSLVIPTNDADTIVSNMPRSGERMKPRKR